MKVEGDDSSVKSWIGGSTDFSFIDEEAPPLRQELEIQNLKKSVIDFLIIFNQTEFNHKSLNHYQRWARPELNWLSCHVKATS